MRLAFPPAALLAIALVLSGCGGASTGSGGGSGPGGGSGGGSSPPPLFTITNQILPRVQVGVPFSVQFVTQNGTAPYTWKAVSQLPSGVSFDTSTGVLSGTATAPSCPFTITINVLDSSNPVQTATVNLAFNAEQLGNNLQQGQIGTYYNDTVNLACGTEPVTWTLLSGSLPPGTQMQPFPGTDSQLNVQGNPTQSGTFNFSLQAQDPNFTFKTSAAVNILPAPLKLTDGLMQLAVVGKPFDHTVTLTGGAPPYSFTLSTGSLPAGLQINATTGEITGTPQTAGLTQFTVSIKDSSGITQFSINKPDSILVTPATLSSRNDTIASATPIFPGTYYASLSPYTDSSGNAAPDQDYYVMTGVNSGETYEVGVGNGALSWNGTYSAPLSSSAYPAIEVVDANGNRLATCNDPVADKPPSGAPYSAGAGNFTDPCISVGSPDGPTVSSYVDLQTSSPNQTFYIHVFDFQGRARPDFTYTLTVTKK